MPDPTKSLPKRSLAKKQPLPTPAEVALPPLVDADHAFGSYTGTGEVGPAKVEEPRGPDGSVASDSVAAMEGIVETLYAIDMTAVHARLEKELLMDENLLRDLGTGYGALLVQSNRAEDNARLADKLYRNARLVLTDWTAKNEKVKAAIWADANGELQAEKDAGKRSKAITDADVRARAAALYPDEWAEQENREAKLHGTAEYLKQLSVIWLSRCRTLQAMISTVRK